jgi:hypothetical protein
LESYRTQYAGDDGVSPRRTYARRFPPGARRSMSVPAARAPPPGVYKPAPPRGVANLSPGDLLRCVGKDPTRGYLAWRPTKTKEPAFQHLEAFGELRFEK